MSVEQTDQLIRLILNSTLLMTACTILLSAVLMRHSSMLHRLQGVQRNYLELLRAADLSRHDRLIPLKVQLRHLRQHYQIAHVSVLMAQSALLLCIGSTLVIACRTLIQSNWLIQGALILFVAGTTFLLVSVAAMLFDFRTTNHSLWEEINWTLSLGSSLGSSLSSTDSSPKGSTLHRSTDHRSRLRSTSY
ncbi:DUF2721 domain-containing protein [Thermocoleostomius sinensis]|uniref:DUF2721 domain-containing protein n=1 Tax=Thermocoleostomius sinensis A174 TaxID=2016057 RepID=A0A9E8ZG51_9CYAN|nr:DUF2721 domain-containing protein [Thermocoleostomius sinensis]WAL60600.1 DUF2721 domain-containing protein [Thermocoleostomius sinensis A174]